MPAAFRITWKDFVIFLVFILYALLFVAGRCGGVHPFLALGSDARIYAGIAAGYDHPEMFRNDPLLGNLKNVAHVREIILPLLRQLTRWTGDYGSSFMLLLLPVVIFYLCGYYILGRVVLQSRGLALIAGFMSTICLAVSQQVQEYWGLIGDPLPRVLYSSLFPFVLAGALASRDRPRIWPWLMVLMGLLLYVHPVSGPACGFALWLALWAQHPTHWKPRRRIMVMLALGALFVAVTAPFIFVEVHKSPPVPPSLAVIHARATAISSFKSPISMYRDLVTVAGTSHGFFWIWGLFATPFLLGGPDRTLYRVLLLWTAGLLVVTIGGPLVVEWAQFPPPPRVLELYIFRSIRYLIIVLQLLCLGSIRAMINKLLPTAPPRRRSLMAIALALIAATAWSWNQLPEEPFVALRCARLGGAYCHPRWWDDLREALDAVKNGTPVGSRIMAEDATNSIRFYSLRPLAYSETDGMLFAMTNPTALVDWYHMREREHAARAAADPQDKLRKFISLGLSLNAGYLLIKDSLEPGPVPSHDGVVLWRNGSFSLIALTQSVKSSAH